MPHDCWTIAKTIMPVADRVLLHGPPSTGKTYLSQREALNNQGVYSITLTEYTAMHEIRGTNLPMITAEGDRKWEWVNGPGLEAYEHGHRFVVNELDKTSEDCMTFLLNLFDDRAVSFITLPTGRIIRPHPNFTVVATMNADPSDLPEALKSRFPISIHMDHPNPKAVESLPQDLQASAAASCMLEPERRIDMRQWFQYAALRDLHEINEEIAAEAVFGTQAQEVINALKMGRTYGEYTGW